MAKRNNAKKTEIEVTEVEAPVTEVTNVEPAKRPKAEPIVLTKEQKTEMEQLTTASAQIRYLAGQKFSTSQIATYLNKRYQHVRNVLTTELKRKN